MKLLDGLGLAATAAAGVAVVVHLGAQRVEEVDLTVDPAEAAAGFREGTTYLGLYRDTEKVGVLKTTRTREGEGFAIDQRSVLWAQIPALGQQKIVLDTVVTLDRSFELVRFEAQVEGPIQLSAIGSIDGDELVVEIEGLGEPQTQRIALSERPAVDVSMQALVQQLSRAPGKRVSYRSFDPLSGGFRDTVLEYVGEESLTVMDQQVTAHRIRTSVAGQTLELYLNDAGEVLQQTMPGSIRAFRESEAEAYFGLPEGPG